jgi:predicted RNA-binding Zn-ribbon protein involved in translation (DUF1610 family)
MMDYLFERVAYLRGLSEGLELDESTKEGKLLVKIVDALEDFADAIADLDEEVEELMDFVDIIDEDLADLEDFIYDEDVDYDFEDAFDEFECPKCGTVIYVDEDDFDEEGNVEIACPTCQEEYVITDDFEEECCSDCDCKEVQEKA